MRKYTITDGSGRYWNGRCFAVRQAAEEYDSVDDLPESISDNGTELELDTFADDDARYYSEDSNDAAAWSEEA